MDRLDSVTICLRSVVWGRMGVVATRNMGVEFILGGKLVQVYKVVRRDGEVLKSAILGNGSKFKKFAKFAKVYPVGKCMRGSCVAFELEEDAVSYVAFLRDYYGLKNLEVWIAETRRAEIMRVTVDVRTATVKEMEAAINSRTFLNRVVAAACGIIKKELRFRGEVVTVPLFWPNNPYLKCTNLKLVRCVFPKPPEDVPVAGHQWLDGETLEVSFSPQSAPGEHETSG